MSIFDSVREYRRKRQGKRLIEQITRQHPELNHLEGDDKINRFVMLCFRFTVEQREWFSGDKPYFNEILADAHPELRDAALAYLTVETPVFYHEQLINLVTQIQDLKQLVDEQNKRIAIQDELIRVQTLIVDGAKGIAEQADKQIRDINKASRPDSRVN